MKKHYRKENDCLNCGTILEGKFCHNCGQENLEMKESFGHMMNHAISDYFHFDYQFFHTLKPLFFKPGFLTTEYLAGRRARYLHPVKMYIFISLVYFIVLFQASHQVVNVNVVDPSTHKVTNSIISMDTSDNTADSKAKEQYKNSSKHFFSPTTKDSTYGAYLATQQKLPPNKQDGFILKEYNKKAFAYKAEYGPRTKEVLIEQFQHNMPKMMFLMLPICALILMIAFWNNKKYYVEHLIYSFHLHCFIFLFLIIIMVLQWLYPPSWTGLTGWISFFATVAIIWYLYKSLKAVYNRNAWRTVSKLIGASIMYFLAFTVCVTLAFLITALTAA